MDPPASSAVANLAKKKQGIDGTSIYETSGVLNQAYTRITNETYKPRINAGVSHTILF
jgi:hypothetical protein